MPNYCFQPDLPDKPNLELSFEYLMTKNCLKWITISSDQAMLMTVCLQSMVTELLNQKSGNDLNNIEVNYENNIAVSYVRRDEHKSFQKSNGRMSESSSTDTISSLVSQINGRLRQLFNSLYFHRTNRMAKDVQTR